MSTFIGGFDGVTCCNCGLSQDAHLRSYGVDAPEPALLCLEVGSSQFGTTQVVGAVGLGAAYLARELLDLVQRNRWWVHRPADQCGACGYAEGTGHHPACRYALLAEQIGRLS